MCGISSSKSSRSLSHFLMSSCYISSSRFNPSKVRSLALALKAESLALALKAESLSLALKPESLTLALRVKSLLTSLLQSFLL